MTKMEKHVHKLWTELLEVNNIGVEDNFFQLGDGTVLAFRLVSMAREDDWP